MGDFAYSGMRRGGNRCCRCVLYKEKTGQMFLRLRRRLRALQSLQKFRKGKPRKMTFLV